jgi:hypothetical protein
MFYWDSYGDSVQSRRRRSALDVGVSHGNDRGLESARQRRLLGHRVGAAYKFDAWDNGWQLSIIGGGPANDNHFNNTDAIYSISIVGVEEETRRTVRSISADVLRQVFHPDFPLLYVAYQRKVSEQFSYLGVPSADFHWRAVSREHQVDYTADQIVAISPWLTKSVAVFTSSTRLVMAFTLKMPTRDGSFTATAGR